MNYSKGVSWIDDCRIPFTDGGWGKRHNQKLLGWKDSKSFTHGEQHLQQNDKGRFPANLLCSDDVLNDGSVSKSREKYPNENLLPMDYYGGLKKEYPTNTKQEKDGFTDKGTNSRYYDIDKWFDYLLNKLQNDTDGTIY